MYRRGRLFNGYEQTGRGSAAALPLFYAEEPLWKADLKL